LLLVNQQHWRKELLAPHPWVQRLLFSGLGIHAKGTTKLGRDGMSLLEKSQRLINENFATETKNFELWEIGLVFSFIMMPSQQCFPLMQLCPMLEQYPENCWAHVH
jgi:hypothetical protein